MIIIIKTYYIIKEKDERKNPYAYKFGVLPHILLCGEIS